MARGGVPIALGPRQARRRGAAGARERPDAARDLRCVEHGLRLSGLSPDGSLVEIVELTGHPWFLGCQFHPELQSRPNRPHPLFASFIGAAAAHRAHGTNGAGDRPAAAGSLAAVR